VVPHHQEQIVHSPRYGGLIRENRNGFSINKAGRVRWIPSGFCCTRSESLRRTFLDRVSKTAAYTRSLFRPCPGRRVEKPGRLSSKASTEAAVFVDGSSATDRTLDDLPFSGAGGRLRSRFPRLVTCQCVSLAFRSGGHSQQLSAFLNGREK
jgi:hypothetical protein